VLALFLLPLFGTLSDKVNTPLGKRIPFILAGTGVAVCSMIFLPIGDRINSLPVFFCALGVALLGMSLYRSPAVALMPDLTPKPLRSKANAVINLMGALGGVIILLLVGVMVPDGERPNYLPLFATVAVLMVAMVVVLLFTIREKKLAAVMAPDEPEKEAPSGHSSMPRDVRRSFAFMLSSIFLWFMGYNAITSAFSKYANIYWGLEGGVFAYTLLIAQGAAIISFLPAGILASRIGRRKTILGGIVMLSAAFAAAAFFREFSVALFLFFALAGIGWAAINVNSYPMVVEMSRGADIGKYTGLYYTFSMAAQIVTPIFSGFLLQYVGYWTLFPYGALFAGLSFFTMLWVRHGDSRPKPASSRLEAYNVAD
jgi:Na+/melibiose symporter-like transporter